MVLDEAACYGDNVIVTSRNVKVEMDAALGSGLGAVTMYDCPTTYPLEQFQLDFEGTTFVGVTGNVAAFP